ncbi:hypothetical protein [Klebsiella aerogenes]|uniref:Uncharacterized protein n=1 Tax=Klebsiella aerogenes TaxID=548 RepID=A0AAP9U5X0_KLEAE|nr:hypothetical protein [Klebsiella aerogenes]QMR40625.1 hypothetical protein HV331_14465 [Klebsiella aerogenes]
MTGLSPGKCGLTSRRGSAAARQAVHQDNDAQALMEVGTGNSRFVSVRYGFTACDRVAGGACVALAKLKNGAAPGTAGLTTINTLLAGILTASTS